MEKTTTIHGMTPVELAKCRENLKRQWESRQVDEELIQRAWKVAHHLAAVLYQDYGATKVAVFGSLTTPICFTERSDIDIVVWGISYERCLDALWGTEDLSTEFKIDIIDSESINKLFRKRIFDEAIHIEKDKSDIVSINKQTKLTTCTETEGIYNINQDKLIHRISDERVKIKKTVQGIKIALHEIDVVAEKHKKYIEKTIASDLVEIYNGFEKVFQRIAREIDKNIPSGSRWHRKLLDQMTENYQKRPPVISQRTSHRLKQLLRFRHRMNNIYRYELIFEKVKQHAKEISQLYEDVSKELDAFTKFLSDT